MLPIRTTFAAALLTVGTAAPAWAAPLFTNAAAFDAATTSNAFLNLTSDVEGQYGTNDLAGSFSGFPGGGPTDADAATYRGTDLQFSGVPSSADPTITVSASGTSGSGSDVFFVLNDPNDVNDVDASPGSNHEEPVPYVSYYGPEGAQVIFDFDTGDDPGISAFAFESFDLAEGAIEVLWKDGSITDMEMIYSGTFVGIADPALSIDRVTVTTMTNQGVALSNIQTAVAVPSPTAALTALPILCGVVLMRLRRA